MSKSNIKETKNFTNNDTGYLTEEEFEKLLIKYDNGTLEPTKKEKLVINPRVAYEITDEMIQNSIPDNIGSYKHMYGKINHFSKTSPVANLHWDYLYFVDSDVFRPAAMIYQKSLRTRGARKATYCSYPEGTTAYKKFWSEEFKRCTEGYEPIVDGKKCGVRIGGEFYFYLNYGRINKIVETEDGRTSSILDMPDFLAMDYYYYREIEARNTPSVYGFDDLYRKALVVLKSRRKGMPQTLTSVLYNEEGCITMGDIKIGDNIYNQEGKLVTVIQIHKQGKIPVYEVKLRDGRIIECGEHHLWRVYGHITGGKREYKIFTTRELIDSGLSKPHTNKKNVIYKYYIESNKCIPYKKRSVKINAYVLGYLIGDGNLTKTLKISVGDEDKKESLERILRYLNNQYDNKYEIRHSNGDGFNYRLFYQADNIEEIRKLRKVYNKSSGSRIVNPLYEELKCYGLNCKSTDKRIPEDYLYNDEETRLEVLRGLLDSDGSISTTGGISFAAKGRGLSQDITNLCRSLGIHCTFKDTVNKNSCYRIYIHTNKPVFKLKRKLARLKEQKANWEFTPIVDIIKTDRVEEQQCITVDSDDHMYLTDGYTPTHNSYKAAASSVWIMTFNNNSKVGIASAPDTNQTDAALCASKAVATIDHLSNHTPFGRKKVGNVKTNGGWKNEISSYLNLLY